MNGFNRLPELWGAVLATALAACGGGSPTGPGQNPTTVPYGVTTFVVVVNPVVNDANQATLPASGTVRSGVTVSVQGGPSGVTDANGVAVLADITPGTKTISLSGSGLTGSVQVSIADKDLREVAIALTQSGAAVMANVRYPFGGTVVEVTPSMTVAQVNAALAQSTIIVFFRAGTYNGDLVFAGSNTTLFGEGPMGGQVVLNGNVTVDGSSSRIRGARILGTLTAPGSQLGFSFGRVAGTLDVAGSSPVFMNNAFCGSITIGGSGATALGNAGMTPIPAPGGGC